MSESKKRAPGPASPGAGADAPKTSINSIASKDAEIKQNPNIFAIIPARVRYDKALKPNAKLLYGEIQALTQAEGYCWASNAYLAELYDLTPANVGRLIAQLEQRGYITREIIRDEETNAVTGRKIWINLDMGGLCTPPGKNAEGSRQKCGDPPGKKAGENNININNIPPISPKGEGEQAEPEQENIQDKLFESFWARYPARHGRKNGKAQARKAWKGLKVTPKLYDGIMSGLEAYRESDEVQRDYAMDAVRWLRGRRWEDEVVTGLNPDTPPDDGLLPGENVEDYLWLPD